MSISIANHGIQTNKTNETENMIQTKPKHSSTEPLILAIISFFSSLIIGYVLVFKYNIIYVDAWTRALEPLYTVFHPGFHLAAMGFVWNPLPSLLMLPFAIARNIWPPLMRVGFAANILSSLFAGVAVYHLNRIYRRFNIIQPFRILWSLLYLTTPMILLYSSNGMTDGMACATFIACLDGVIAYFNNKSIISIVRASIWLAAAFMIRYEAVPVGALLGLGVFLTIYINERNWKKAQAIAIMLWFLVVSAGLIWMLLNWMIMKNPLYFLTSNYGNSSQISSGTYNNQFMLAASHHLPVAISEVIRFSILFWPFYPVLALVVIIEIFQRKKSFGWPIILASLGSPILQIALLYLHKSADWSRFFIYYIPFGFILMGYAVSKIIQFQALRKVNYIIFSVFSLLIISAFPIDLQAIQNKNWGHGDTGFTLKLLTGNGHNGGESSQPYLIPGIQVANYINSHPQDKVLLSTFHMFGAVPYLKNPNQVVLTNDTDYKSVLDNPRGRVNLILVESPQNVNAKTDTLVSTYPTMWYGGVSWTKLVHQFSNGDRMFEVLSTAP